MLCKFDGELRRVEAREYTSKEGKKGTSYNLLVECGVESFQFPTTKEVCEDFQKGYLEKGNMCVFTAEYNPRYQFNNFVVKSVEIQ